VCVELCSWSFIIILYKNVLYLLFKAHAAKVISHLSLLADEDIEALRILQTIIVMMTTSHVIQKDSLAQVVNCFPNDLRVLISSQTEFKKKNIKKAIYMHC